MGYPSTPAKDTLNGIDCPPFASPGIELCNTPYATTQTRFQNNRAGNCTRTKSFRYRSHHMRAKLAAGSKLDDSSNSCSNAEEGSGLQITGQGAVSPSARPPSPPCAKQIPSICTVASFLWGLLCPPSATFSNGNPPLPSVADSRTNAHCFVVCIL